MNLEFLKNTDSINDIAFAIRKHLFSKKEYIHPHLEKKIKSLKNIDIEIYDAYKVPSCDSWLNYDYTTGYATIYLSDSLNKYDRNFALLVEFGKLIFDYHWSFENSKPEDIQIPNPSAFDRNNIDYINNYRTRRNNQFATSFLIPHTSKNATKLSETDDLYELMDYYGVSSLILNFKQQMFEEYKTYVK